MYQKLFLAMILFSLLSCRSTPKDEIPTPVANHFEKMDGCFLLYNLKTNTFDKIIGEEVCQRQLPACSTFKVPLAVMAFDAGILKDETTVLKWDGKVDPYREEVNRDHTAATWMSQSVVWYSQKITPRLGKNKFQKYLNNFDYGNKDLRGGITNAWLVGASSKEPALRISAYQQIDFMKKLWTDNLPASKRAMQLTRNITYLETSPKGFKLNGKTGSNFYDKARKQHLGWFISHIQNGDQEYLAVTNISDLAPVETKGYGGIRAKEITKKILAEQGLW